MILTLFDTIGGFSTYAAKIDSSDVEGGDRYQSQQILDNAIFVMPPKSKGIIVVSRYLQKEKLVTWIGAYRPLPADLNKRKGDYVGAGLYMANTVIDGEFIEQVLENLLNETTNEMNHFTVNNWNSSNARATVVDRTPEIRQIPARCQHLGERRGLSGEGSHYCAIALGEAESSVPELIESIQSAEEFHSFQKTILLRDDAALQALNRKAVMVLNDSLRVGMSQDIHAGNSYRDKEERVPSQRYAGLKRRPGSEASKSGGDGPQTAPAHSLREVRSHASPWVSYAALVLGIINSVLICLICYGQLQVSDRIDELRRAAADLKAEVRRGDGGPSSAANNPQGKTEPADGRVVEIKDLKRLVEILDRMSGEEAVRKSSSLKRALDEAREVLRQAMRPSQAEGLHGDVEPGPPKKAN